MPRTVVIIGCLLCLGIVALFVASGWRGINYRLWKGGPSGFLASGFVLLRTDDIFGAKAWGTFGRPSIFGWSGWNHWQTGPVFHTPSPGEWFTHPDGRVLPPTTQPRPAVFMGYAVNFPIYVLFLIVAAPTVFLWLRHPRHYPPQYCQRCGYDLTGNVSGRCPECGVRREDRQGGVDERAIR
jgi:hypothetical protein